MRPIFHGFWAGTVLLVTFSSAEAQPGASAYAVAGPGGYSAFFGSRAPNLFVGGGVDVLSGPGVGGEVEAGLFADESGGLLAALSFNGVARLRNRASRGVRPFVSAGYTLAYTPESDFKAWNVGGGLTSAATGRIGWRLDFRDHIRPDRRGRSHYWAVRAGITFQ